MGLVFLLALGGCLDRSRGYGSGHGDWFDPSGTDPTPDSPGTGAPPDGRSGASPGRPSGPPPAELLGVVDDYASPPVWEVGRSWHATIASRLLPVPETVDLVVAGVSDGTATVLATSEQQALLRPFHDLPHLGELGRANLTRVAYGHELLRFPLAENAGWTVASADHEWSVRTFQIQDGALRMEAARDGDVVVRYSYDPELGFYRHLEVVGADGQASYAMDVASTSTGFQGDVYDFQWEEAMGGYSSDALGQVDDWPFEVAPEHDRIAVAAEPQCDVATGAWQIRFVPPPSTNAADAGLMVRGTCTSSSPVFHTVTANAAGAWRYTDALAFEGSWQYEFISGRVERTTLG